MKITFDPNNPDDVVAVRNFLGGAEETPVTITGGVMDTGGTGQAISESPEDRQDPVNPELDSLGMPHNAEYHQSPPKLNADGTFKCLRGAKEKLAAAIEAHKAAQSAPATNTMMSTTTKTPAATMPGMPGAAPVVDVPPEPIGFEEMCTRFANLMSTGAITDFNEIYEKAGVPRLADGSWNAAALQTEETLRAKLWSLMDEIDG